MSNSESISITLSPAQVDQVVRAAAQGRAPSFSALISNTLTARRTGVSAAGPPHEHAAEASAASREPSCKQHGGNAGGGGYFPNCEDARLSRSLLRGLAILTCFGPENDERGIIELAGQLRMSPSTTHRYVATLVELGLLERDSRSRKYRLALLPSEGTAAP